MEKLFSLAKRARKTIVLPESRDQRILHAAKKAAEIGIAKILLIGNESETASALGPCDRESIRVIDPARHDKTGDYANELYGIRKSKGLKKNEAKELVKNPLYFGTMLVRAGDADGMVCGAATSSTDVIRAALQVVQCEPGTLVSSCIVMDVSENKFIDSEIWGLADCVINIDPDTKQLASIAVSTAATMKNLLGGEPRVAMLSFSTHGSSKHELAQKVAYATEIVRSDFPGMLIEGEIQFDAAVIKEVSDIKCPNSRVNGHANVLIFPDIQAGNIGYKIIERLGGGKFIGCVTQGLNHPVNDLSRGCNTNDVVNAIALTAVQTQADTK